MLSAHLIIHTHTLAVVDSSLPESLKHLVSNAEYYGPSIYLPGTSVHILVYAIIASHNHMILMCF